MCVSLLNSVFVKTKKKQNNRCIATITAELAVPRTDRPHEGTISISLKYPAHYKMHKSNVQRIVSILERGIKESQCMDVESLCILAGETVWSLYLDISVIQDYGNVIDCANLAIIAAMKSHRRPDVTVVGSKVSLNVFFCAISQFQGLFF